MDTKKSFFEKITGTKSVNDESTIIVPDSSTSKPNMIKMETNVQKNIPIQVEMPKETYKEPREDKKEALPEEGQLVLDVYQDEGNIIVKSTLAGVRSEDVDITITNDMLSIRGVREKDEDIRDDDYYYQECYWGAFSRSVILPMEVEADMIKASLKNGILTIILPKAEKIRTKKILISD